MSIFLTTQSFRSVGTIIRNNATNILIFRQNNAKELDKIREEYAELCGSEELFMTYYNLAHDTPFSFLYIDAQSNPAKFYRRHEVLLGEGDNKIINENPKEKMKPFSEEELKVKNVKKKNEVDLKDLVF